MADDNGISVIKKARNPLPLPVKARRPRAVSVRSSGGSGTRTAGLIATKMAPPTQAVPWVDRLHLIAPLTAGHRRRLLIVTAPAGYGKTVLICQYHRKLAEEGADVAWFGFDRGGEDGETLLAYLAAALGLKDNRHRGSPALGTSDWSRDPPLGLGAMLARLASRNRDIHLFLDDVHYCRDRGALDLLTRLIKNAPPNLHFVIASREPPRLPIARLKAEGLVATVDWSELLFGPEEARTLLARSGSPALTDGQMNRLVEATEGWVMGLNIAVAALGRNGDAAGFIERFSGKQEDVADYLADDVLESLDEKSIDFLMRTSVLNRFSIQLCNDLFETSDTAEIIARLDRSNSFIFSLDDCGQWFRYHNLFQDMLRKRLDDLLPGEAERVQRAASRWFAERGHHLDALETARATGDDDFVAATLNGVCDSLFRAGQFHLLRREIAQLPTQIVARFPHLTLLAAWMADLHGDPQQAQHLLSLLEGYHGEDPSLADRYSTVIRLDDEILHRQMMSALSRGEMGSADFLCRELLTRSTLTDKYLLASVHASQLFARHHLFDCRGITGRADQIIELLPAEGRRNGSIWTHCIAGLVLQRRGELDEAKRAFTLALEDALNIADEGGLAGMPATLLAQICYERNEIDEAGQLLDDHASKFNAVGLIDQFSSGPIVRSRLASLSGDRAGAAKLLDRSIDFAIGRGLDRVRKALVAERVRLAAEEGRPEEAMAIARANGITLDMKPPRPCSGASTWDLLDAITWTRVAVNAGEYRQVAANLRAWADYCRAQGCELLVTQITVQLAQLAMLSGDPSRALRLMKSAITAGAEMGLVRTFLDEGGNLRSLLAAIDGDPAGLSASQRIYLGALLRRFPDNLPAASGKGSMQDLVDCIATPLTGREVEILILAGRGIKGRYIANELAITEGTVKWYMQQIFDKLNVRNRAEAVARARELGFIP